MRAASLLVVVLSSIPGVAAAVEAVPFVLPPTEVAEEWTTALAMAGMEAAQDPTPGASVVLRAEREDAWILIVTDPDGAVRRAEVDPLRSARAREGVALLASSLLEPVSLVPGSADGPETPVFTKPDGVDGRALRARRAAGLEARSTAMLGAGLVVGAPTGVTGKAYLGGRGHALEGAIGVAAVSGFSAHGGWLLHPSVLYASSAVAVPWHVGVGGFAQRPGSDEEVDRDEKDDRDDDPPPPPDVTSAGVRVPLGIDLDLRSAPLQLFFDVALLVAVTPAPRPAFDGAVGGRWFFR